MSDRKTVAVVGCGIGRLHLAEGYAAHPDKFRVAALCDIDAEKLAATADEFGIPDRYADFAALLADPDIDIVDICTPPGLHVPQASAVHGRQGEYCCEAHRREAEGD